LPYALTERIPDNGVVYKVKSAVHTTFGGSRQAAGSGGRLAVLRAQNCLCRYAPFADK
jgi:hypothetical protein